jgi:hypothetical protein
VIPEEPTYGWGAGGLPMPREAVRTPLRPAPSVATVPFARDLPWRGLLGSVLLTIIALASLLYLSRYLPPVTLHPQMASVKITVRLPEPTVEVPVMVEQPPPTIKPPEAPPRTRPVRTPPPEIRAQSTPEIAMQRTAPAPALPIMAEQEPGPAEAAELPRTDRTVQLGGNEAPSLGPGPDLRPRGERSSSVLPERGSVVLGSPAPLDLATIDSGMPRQQHYRADRGEAEIAEPVRQATLRVDAGEASLGIDPALHTQRFQGSTAADSLPEARPAAATLGRAPVEVIPLPPPAVKPKEAPAVSSLPAGAASSFDHLDRMAPADLDGMYLVSLNRLRTCRDPQTEMKLRTQLASLVRQPGTCRTGGVVFAILQPETAWSIHVDIYDFEQREFQDRCAALGLAAQCLEGVRR